MKEQLPLEAMNWRRLSRKICGRITTSWISVRDPFNLLNRPRVWHLLSNAFQFFTVVVRGLWPLYPARHLQMREDNRSIWEKNGGSVPAGRWLTLLSAQLSMTLGNTLTTGQIDFWRCIEDWDISRKNLCTGRWRTLLDSHHSLYSPQSFTCSGNIWSISETQCQFW